MKILSTNVLKGVNGKDGYLVKFQDYKGVGVPKIIAGRTPKGTYFYKEACNDKSGKFVYTVFKNNDGTYSEATDLGYKFIMRSGKKGYTIDDIFIERIPNAKKPAYTEWVDDMNGDRFVLPKDVSKTLKSVRKKNESLAQRIKESIMQIIK